MENLRPVTDIYDTPLFPYIEGDVLAERSDDLVLTIQRVLQGEMASSRGTEEKVIVQFRETDKALILNKTNAAAIWQLYGRKTADWIGKRIALYCEPTRAFGKMHNAIRVRHTVPAKPQRSQRETRAVEPTNPPDGTEDADELPDDYIGPSEFWTEFHNLKRDGKLPNADKLRDAEPIKDANHTGDWAAALKWLHGQMEV
jgi:hypothetical protein